MRRVALTTIAPQGIRRVILHATDLGVHLHLRLSVEDDGCFADEWYPTVEDAEERGREHFGITATSWRDVPDSEPGCFDDRVAPTRVRPGSETAAGGAIVERRVDGVWVAVPDVPFEWPPSM